MMFGKTAQDAYIEAEQKLGQALGWLIEAHKVLEEVDKLDGVGEADKTFAKNTIEQIESAAQICVMVHAAVKAKGNGTDVLFL